MGSQKAQKGMKKLIFVIIVILQGNCLLSARLQHVEISDSEIFCHVLNCIFW